MKKKLNMPKAIAIFAFLTGVFIFSGCDKNTDVFPLKEKGNNIQSSEKPPILNTDKTEDECTSDILCFTALAFYPHYIIPLFALNCLFGV